MTYQYINLAIGRLPRYRDIQYVELYTEDGNPIPPMTDREKFIRYGDKQIADYWIEDGGIHCKLKGVYDA